MSEQYVTVKEAMAILGRTKPTIYKLARQGLLHVLELPVPKAHGQRIYFDRREVETLRRKIETPVRRTTGGRKKKRR